MNDKELKELNKFKVLRANRLVRSIIGNKISEIGKIREQTKKIDLNADKKRLWFEKLTGINDKMNRSLPLSLNYFSKDEI